MTLTRISASAARASPSGVAGENGGFVVYLEDQQQAADGHPAPTAATFGSCAAYLAGTLMEQKRQHERFHSRVRE